MRAVSVSARVLALASFIGLGVVIGCSASGGGDVIADPEPTDPTGEAQLPPAPTGSNQVTSDAGPTPKDAGPKTDSGPVDAGPPPPTPGTACSVPDEVRKKQCGACGTHSTLCLGGKWTEYGICEGEVPGGCIPGTKVTEACGNCGTQTRTCNNYCAFTTSACTGSPAGACTPGGVDLSNAGCASADTYRSRTCNATCAYSSFTTACAPPPSTVEVPPTTGTTNSTIVIIDEASVLPRATGTCPNATLSTTVSTPYTYAQVHNPNAKAATVSIYNSLASGGVAFKTMLIAYDGATPPADDTARKACVKLRTFGTTALTGDAKFASLDGTSAVTIPAGGTVTVFVGAYNAFDATKPADSTGKVKLNVQTMSLQ
ncbi:MAG: hypothetical protein JST00_18465 [Deltaproteobacteria bacterium]|nr:hypothetical protein [Deltaproteobacteria bacterium]